MPRSGPQGVDPTEIFPFTFGETPADEQAYFRVLSWFVFGSGLNWRVLKMKWPAFLTAFANFDPKTVASYQEREIDRLLGDAGIIRNGRKIIGTIENARQLNAIATEAGGMTSWLRGFGTDVDGMVRAVKKRFSHMGDVTTRMFLSAVGAIEYDSWKPTQRQREGRP